MPFLPIANKGKIDRVTDSPKFGTVVDNNDPLKLGRVKVEITGIFEKGLRENAGELVPAKGLTLLEVRY